MKRSGGGGTPAEPLAPFLTQDCLIASAGACNLDNHGDPVAKPKLGGFIGGEIYFKLYLFVSWFFDQTVPFLNEFFNSFPFRSVPVCPQFQIKSRTS